MGWTDWFKGGSSGGGGGTNWWGAAIAGIASYASSRSANKNASKNASKELREGGIEARRTSAFDRDLDYYYEQLDKSNKRKALDSAYHPFSKFASFAPSGYKDPALPTVPSKPNAG